MPYTLRDFWQFGTISLPEKSKKETYIFFKAKRDGYSAIDGEMTISLKARWHDEKGWREVEQKIYTLTEEISRNWNSPTGNVRQINSVIFDNIRGSQS